MEITVEFVREKLSYAIPLVKRTASGKLFYDYLVPGGPSYPEQWDWDAFFIGVALSSENPAEAIYLKNWALNYILNAAADGRVAGCITPEGADPRLNHMKPFLGQGILIGSRILNDFDWFKPHWETIKKIALYRENHLWSKEYDLGIWYDHMESGADNNPSILGFPAGTVIGTDLNAFLYQEYKALSLLAYKIGATADGDFFKERSATILAGMNKYLWDETDQIYYNRDSRDGSVIKYISYSSFVPLWAKMAPHGAGRETITRYVLNSKHLFSQFGIRTLSCSDPLYNNANIIKPFSNWQGPVWPITNYIYLHGLINYGFREEAIALAKTISKLVIADIEKTGGMHEDYDAETGEGLAAPFFVSWNLLVRNMLAEAVSGKNPFLIE